MGKVFENEVKYLKKIPKNQKSEHESPERDARFDVRHKVCSSS